MAGGNRRSGTGWSTDAQRIVDRVFVYGSLRSGQAARSMIENHVVSSKPATTTGRIYAVADGFPGLLEDKGGTVIGELVELRELPAALSLLDAYEGDEFSRVLKTVRLGSGRELPAWCYVLVDESLLEGAELIAGGDWVAYEQDQS